MLSESDKIIIRKRKQEKEQERRSRRERKGNLSNNMLIYQIIGIQSVTILSNLLKVTYKGKLF